MHISGDLYKIEPMNIKLMVQLEERLETTDLVLPCELGKETYFY